MIVDFHTHIFPNSVAPRAISSLVAGSGGKILPHSDGTATGLVSNMDEAGIDISVIQPVLTGPQSFLRVNTWAHGLTSDRIVPFAGLYPTEDYKSHIDTIASMGFRGIKLHPEFQGFNVDDPAMLPLYDYAFEKGLILLFHAGYDPSFEPPYRATPRMFRAIFDRLGGGTVVAAHLGGQKLWDEVEEYLVGTEIYLDTAMGFPYYGEERFLRILRAHGADKILFGSDSPWGNAKNEIASIRSLPIAEEEKAQVLGGNAMRLLYL